MTDLRLKEIYSNLKNYDWNIFPSYKMDKVEARKYCEAIEDMEHGGWILCGERLPNDAEYNKCNGQFIVTDGNRVYSEYFDKYDRKKFGEPTMEGFRVDRCVIAWQPLPEWRGKSDS